MPYLTPADLAERPGATELAQVASSQHGAMVDYALMDATLRGADRSAWAVDAVAAADEALGRVQNAVTEAESMIDGFLVKRGYPLPLSPVPALVTGWARSIARYLLHKDRISDDRSDPIARDYRDALKFLGLTAEGKFSLGAADPVVSVSATDVRFESDVPVFSRGELRGFR